MIRNAVEQVTGLPMIASTEGMISTGPYKTVEEFIDGHLLIQKLRMSRTAAGRRILHHIGLEAKNVTPLDVLLDVWREERKMLPLLSN